MATTNVVAVPIEVRFHFTQPVQDNLLTPRQRNPWKVVREGARRETDGETLLKTKPLA